MQPKAHIEELCRIIREMRTDGDLKDFEVIRRINAADYEINQALEWLIENES
jgi:hypothetical protein